MGLVMIRAEIERMRHQISRQRKDIQSLQRAGIREQLAAAFQNGSGQAQSGKPASRRAAAIRSRTFGDRMGKAFCASITRNSGCNLRSLSAAVLASVAFPAQTAFIMYAPRMCTCVVN